MEKDTKFLYILECCSKNIEMLVGIAEYHLQTIGDKIAAIYRDSVLDDINDYMTNETLKGYLEKYA